MQKQRAAELYRDREHVNLTQILAAMGSVVPESEPCLPDFEVTKHFQGETAGQRTLQLASVLTGANGRMSM